MLRLAEELTMITECFSCESLLQLDDARMRQPNPFLDGSKGCFVEQPEPFYASKSARSSCKNSNRIKCLQLFLKRTFPHLAGLSLYTRSLTTQLGTFVSRWD